MKSFSAQETFKILNLVLDVEYHVSGIEYLKELVRNIARTFEVKYVLLGHAVKSKNYSIQTDVVWADNAYIDNFTYSLKGTPCENVLSGKRVCSYLKGVANKFPEDGLLSEMRVESYIGAPILKRGKELSGILALLDDKPLKNANFYNAIVDFLAMRIGAELERHYIAEELKRQVIERTVTLERVNKKLRDAFAEIKTLRGIIPICSN